MPRTLLVVGHGPGSRRALPHARRLLLRVVAASPEPTPDTEAGRAREVDPRDAAALAVAAREEGADGLLAASPDAVVAVARAAVELDLPGIGSRAADALASRIALRRRLADAGVPQPRFAAVRGVHEGHAALAGVGVPARLLPAEPWIDGGRFELASADDLDARLHRTLAASSAGEALVEGAPGGVTVDALLACADGRASILAVADRPDAAARVHPSALFGDALAAVERAAVHAAHAIGYTDGVASFTITVAGAAAQVVDAGAWTPDDPLDALARHGTGVDALELALRLAVGAPIRPAPRFQRAAALRLAHLPAPAEAAPGLAERGDGYLVATAETNIAARERVEALA